MDAAGTAAKVEGADAHRGEGLALRALFVYLRNADGVRELQGRELLLWLPPRAGSLLLNGKRVEPEAEAVLHLRRERSGSFVSMDAIAFSGVLPFMLGRASERWLLGSLHSAAVYGEGEGAAGWSLELSGTALGSCAVSRDVRVDVEVLAVGIAVGGRPCCMSAHAPLPTRQARPAAHSRPARGLESIAENEKVRPTRAPPASLRRAHPGRAPGGIVLAPQLSHRSALCCAPRVVGCAELSTP